MDSTQILQAFAFSFFGGIIPALVWLWFWIQEDKAHPEPKKNIFLACLAGFLSVIVALGLQKLVVALGFDPYHEQTVIIFATIEELVKYYMVFLIALRLPICDEPIDEMVYMVAGAIGFAALENMLYILNPLLDGKIAESISTGNLRFIGPSLLHIVASGTIGYFAGLSFYSTKLKKMIYRITGITLACILHIGYNLYILDASSVQLFAFGGVWIAVIVLIVLFERIKEVTQPQN